MFKFTIAKGEAEKPIEKFRQRLTKEGRATLEALRTDIADWLENEQRKGNNGGWQSLSEDYEKRKEASGYGSEPILTRIGTMMERYVQDVQIKPSEMSIELKVPGSPGSKLSKRAWTHLKGYPPRNIPARPFPVDDAGYEELEDIAVNRFVELVRTNV